MLTSKPLLTLTVAITASVAADTFVGVDGATAVAGSHAAGVVNDQYNSGELAPAVAIGTAIVKAGGAITVGQTVEVGADGSAVAATTGAVVGIALTAAADASDRIEVLLK